MCRLFARLHYIMVADEKPYIVQQGLKCAAIIFFIAKDFFCEKIYIFGIAKRYLSARACINF